MESGVNSWVTMNNLCGLSGCSFIKEVAKSAELSRCQAGEIRQPGAQCAYSRCSVNL